MDRLNHRNDTYQKKGAQTTGNQYSMERFGICFCWIFLQRCGSGIFPRTSVGRCSQRCCCYLSVLNRGWFCLHNVSHLQIGNNGRGSLTIRQQHFHPQFIDSISDQSCIPGTYRPIPYRLIQPDYRKPGFRSTICKGDFHALKSGYICVAGDNHRSMNSLARLRGIHSRGFILLDRLICKNYSKKRESSSF